VWPGGVVDRGAAEPPPVYIGIYVVVLFVSLVVWRVLVVFWGEEGGVGAVGAVFCGAEWWFGG